MSLEQRLKALERPANAVTIGERIAAAAERLRLRGGDEQGEVWVETPEPEGPEIARRIWRANKRMAARGSSQDAPATDSPSSISGSE